MFRKVLLAVKLPLSQILVFIALTSGAFAAGWPTAQCTLSEDNSQLIVLASNATETAYSCMAECRFKLTGERANYTKTCNYSLSSNMEEKSVCEVNGDGPDHFSEIMPTRFTCAPR